MDVSIKIIIVIIWSFILVLTSIDFSSTDYIVENNFNTSKQALKNSLMYEVDNLKDGRNINKNEVIKNLLVTYIENQNTKVDSTIIDFLIVSDNPPLVLIRTRSENKNGYINDIFKYDEIHGILIEEKEE